ncbi:unnamed protein product [Schistocephalus solidus]|uniref:Pepsin-I3 domain-containing protein n=1 Tax=Schistocephalus solidus TaxID=70667 RepID=A0A183SV95_SCHSO|nr:unnamed protein product [Schistocephalus solidus]
MHQPPPSAEYNAPRIYVNGAQLKNGETFAYLGSTLSRNRIIDDEVAQLISKASQDFGRLQASMWNRHYNLNYFAPEQQTEEVQGRRLEDTPLLSVDRDSLLKLGQEAESRPSPLTPQNTEAEMARQDPGHGSPGADRFSIHAMLRQLNLRWSSNLVRMDDERLLKRLFPGDVATGVRRQGCQNDVTMTLGKNL